MKTEKERDRQIKTEIEKQTEGERQIVIMKWTIKSMNKLNVP